jgi:hypothetical protein
VTSLSVHLPSPNGNGSYHEKPVAPFLAVLSLQMVSTMPIPDMLTHSFLLHLLLNSWYLRCRARQPAFSRLTSRATLVPPLGLLADLVEIVIRAGSLLVHHVSGEIISSYTSLGKIRTQASELGFFIDVAHQQELFLSNCFRLSP